MRKRNSQASLMTSIQGDIKELRWKSALFETVFCKCFLPVCKCQPLKIWLPKAHCKIENDLWETGSAVVKLPMWLLEKEISKNRNLGLQ